MTVMVVSVPDHVDDAVEHVGHVGSGQIVARAVDDVAEPFENAAGLGRALGQRGRGEADFLHEVKHRGLVGVVMVIVVKRAAAKRENREMNQRHQRHHASTGRS